MMMTGGLTAVCHMDVDWTLVQIEELCLLSGGEKCCANCKDILLENKDKGREFSKKETTVVCTNEQH